MLIKILPFVAQEKCFALKGGTAINLFERDMPRLSVDIDLTYLPFESREQSLKEITQSLLKIKKCLKLSMPNIITSPINQNKNFESKLICVQNHTQVKIEVNTIMRGHILPYRKLPISQQVQSAFNKFASMQVVSKAELFGGKICAALDRQHPRDLFDIYQLLENEGFSSDIKIGFLSCLISHNRPINEMLNPNFIDQENVFEDQFSGMTKDPFSYEDYEETRKKLVKVIKESLSENDRKFLVSFKKGQPDLRFSPAEKIMDLPAVKWKLLNIQKLIKIDADKHTKQLEALKNILE